MSPKRFQWESGRHPFEILLHLWAVMNGGIYLTGAIDQPRSIEEQLPQWLQVSWFGLLLAGGAVGLIAGWQQGRTGHVEQGLRVEAGALCFLSGGAAMYTTALFLTNGMDAFGAGTFVGSYGAACMWRIRHIWKELRLLS